MQEVTQVNSAKTRKSGILSGAGLLGAIAASSCCIVPFVLFSLGISGAWIGHLTSLAPYQPYFMGFTILCLLGSVYWLYWRPRKVACEPGFYCETSKSSWIMKIIVWITICIVCLTFLWPTILRIFLR